MLYNRAAIIGIGLIGGSFALAAKARGLVDCVVGCGRSEGTRNGALAIGAADEVTDDPAFAARDADLVYLAVPVGSMPGVMARIAPALKPGALVTDAGSTKRDVMRAAAEHLPDAAFLGGHPIAGSENAGVSAARADLFIGHTYVLTPGPRVSDDVLARFRSLVEGIGAKPVLLDAESHDAALAATSHLPHVVAASLAAAVGDVRLRHEASLDLRDLFGNGLADTTRIAGGPAGMWRDVLEANGDNVRVAIAVFLERLRALDAALEAGDMDAVQCLLEDGRRARGELMRQ
jgi:prephenate dehydrogenase